MKALAREMGEEGDYGVYVGTLTTPGHNQWADAAIAYQTAHYPQDEDGGGPLPGRRPHRRLVALTFLELRGISKRFGGVVALSSVGFDLRRGGSALPSGRSRAAASGFR